VAALLADPRTDVNARIRDGSSPLHCAVFHGCWQVGHVRSTLPLTLHPTHVNACTAQCSTAAGRWVMSALHYH
jgi:hypothetical protein